MIEPLNATGDIPLLLRGLCTLGGMSLYLATLVWIARPAFGLGNVLTLRQTCSIWIARILMACTLASLWMMIYTGRLFTHPVLAAPEISILLLLTALYLLVEKRRFLNRRHIIARRFPGEILNIAAVTGGSMAALFAAVGFWQLVMKVNAYVHGPDWLPVLATGLLSLVPLAVLFIMVRERDVAEKLKFHYLLWPVLIACFLIMLPDAIAHLRSSPKIEEFMHGRGRLQRVETMPGKPGEYT